MGRAAVSEPPEGRTNKLSGSVLFGKLGGKAAAKNMTAQERTARAKKAAKASAEKRTAERLASAGKRTKRKPRGR